MQKQVGEKRNSNYVTIKERRQKQKRKAQLLIVIAIIVVIALLALFYKFAKPEITLTEGNEITLEYGETFVDPGATAKSAMKDISDRIQAEGVVDDKTLGDYTITYTAKRSFLRTKAERLVHVQDTTGPVITLTGEAEVHVDDDINNYQEPGATAQDIHDGDVSKTITSKVDKTGDYEYTETYTAKDANGNSSTLTRKIMIDDKVPPVITLKGDAKMSIDYGTKYQEPGAAAADERDGDLTEQMTVEGLVDIYKPGKYTITYTVQDLSGNSVVMKREVTVCKTAENPKHAIYLTFDDGPSADVTVSILDTLKKNGIKATFFICDYSSDKKAIIQRMVDEGHTIGIHGYSHDYSKIYKNDEAFLENINKLKDKVKKDTGYDAFVMRFPGGSSNTISNSSNPGLMTRLVQKVTDIGMQYYDWNVDSGDATGNNVDVNKLYKNVVNGLGYERSNVILMHDTKVKKTTAQMLQSLIDYGVKEGYSFLPIEKDTVPVHHAVNN